MPGEIKYPSVEVIIPTLNSMKTLPDCIEGIMKQDYAGKIKISVADGGSSDGTVEYLQKKDIDVIVIPGLYMHGINGAYNTLIKRSSSDLIWHIDSDNIVLEKDTLSNLVEPFIEDRGINISIPEYSIDGGSSMLNKWLSFMDICNINYIKYKLGKFNGKYFLIDDMPYGLTNASLLRRDAIIAVGGFDSDVKTLERLRGLKISRCAIVPSAHIYHFQTTSIKEYVQKQVRRIRKLANMTASELKNYYVYFPRNTTKDKKMWLFNFRFSSLLIPFISIGQRGYFKYVKYGILWLILVYLIVLTHPFIFLKAYKKHFVK
ncbi:MAG: glycosyltransferase [Candidatus Parvarchaeota archaeon]